MPANEAKEVTVEALRQMSGAYGTAAPGDTVIVSEEDAVKLEDQGLAKRVSGAEAKAKAKALNSPENKAITTEETKAAPGKPVVDETKTTKAR